MPTDPAPDQSATAAAYAEVLALHRPTGNHFNDLTICVCGEPVADFPAHVAAALLASDAHAAREAAVRAEALPAEQEFIDAARTIIADHDPSVEVLRSSLGRVWDWLRDRAAAQTPEEQP